VILYEFLKNLLPMDWKTAVN